MQYSVCSIANDHSVALLSLKEPKLILLANRQTSPIVGLRWRINDDFLLIKCFDGSLFVWQIDTGHLERVAHGILAEDLFEWYNDPNMLTSGNELQNEPMFSPITIAHHTQIRSTGKRRDGDLIRKLNKKFSKNFYFCSSTESIDLIKFSSIQVCHDMIWSFQHRSNQQNIVYQLFFINFMRISAKMFHS